MPVPLPHPDTSTRALAWARAMVAVIAGALAMLVAASPAHADTWQDVGTQFALTGLAPDRIQVDDDHPTDSYVAYSASGGVIRIFRWTGTSFSQVGGDYSGLSTYGFHFLGDPSTPVIAQYDGTTWRVVRWNGSSWATLSWPNRTGTQLSPAELSGSAAEPVLVTARSNGFDELWVDRFSGGTGPPWVGAAGTGTPRASARSTRTRQVTRWRWRGPRATPSPRRW